MKKYLATRMRLSALIIVGALVTLALVTPHLVEAQSTSEKIRLMADTLRARDSGDLDLAKEKAEALIKVAPNDENIQRLLASINRDLDRRGNRTAPVVYGQASNQVVEVAMDLQSSVNTADAVVAEAAADQDAKIAAAKDAIADARQLAKLGAYSDASNLLNAASASLTLNIATAGTIEAIEAAKAEIVLVEAKALAKSGDAKGAEALVDQYRSAGAGVDSAAASRLSRQLDKQISDPYGLDINAISPEYVAQAKIIRDLLTRGRAQYLNGDYDGASASFKEVEARDANNPEAKLFQTKIAETLGSIHNQNLYKTRGQMLTEVDQQWERPKVFDISASNVVEVDEGGRIKDKLNAIVIPQVNFSGMELTRVVETLSELSVEYDPERIGVNIIPLFNSNDSNPRVNISLRNLNLDRILQFVTQQVNFAYDVGGDAVTIQPSDSLGGSATSVTEFFPISRATVIRLTGFRDGGGSSSGPVDPFAAPSGGGSSGPSQNDEVEALQSFFQSAGVNFEIPGASLAFDGEQLIVTQSRRNLERMRTILRNYNEVKQVEIEAKFLEVSQNDLEEVGFDWSAGGGRQFVLDEFGAPVLNQFGNPTFINQRQGSTQGRNLNNTFSTGTDASAIRIQTPLQTNPLSFTNTPPSLNSAIDVAANASSLFTATGWTINGTDVDFALRALSRKTGTDLMSAPKVTVLSGKRASITVAQELRYPESYGDIESQVSSGGNGGGLGGGAGSSISITAGTPQDFVTRNVGVEMSVTPNVENDDTISLILEPRVTEFEGFVEYGGPSVALGTDGTVVTVPAGFYQPIFSTREMSTEVTIFDGATVVMGGLTRDEVKSVNDSVPLLGDIPGLGRLFRSEGETRQKRNLLIFVTANLVSPGGSPARQTYRNVNANSLFQNPTIMTPSGSVNRSIEANAE
ncbi:MAG: type II secretory pathway, component PulD [Puniceicoccaceae bacterium]|nr:MAG: type II secretory pathway, component PulD [Puniceicoccaceae bacterium]|tara:strand:- start:5634 stop:8390 length:2757 start_codon:yes stop_codon:yes gene_type:complete